jgi:hypothetical protein
MWAQGANQQQQRQQAQQMAVSPYGKQMVGSAMAFQQPTVMYMAPANFSYQFAQAPSPQAPQRYAVPSPQQQGGDQQRLRQAAPALPAGTPTMQQVVGPNGQLMYTTAPMQATQQVPAGSAPQPAGAAPRYGTQPPRSPPPQQATGSTVGPAIDVRQFVSDAGNMISRNTFVSWILALAEGNEQARSFLDAYTDLIALAQIEKAGTSRSSTLALETGSFRGSGGLTGADH